MNPSFDNYVDFLEWINNPKTLYHKNFAVTYCWLDDSDVATRHCEILQYERSNAKWYKMEPFEGRKEVGYAWGLWFSENFPRFKIEQVRLV